MRRTLALALVIPLALGGLPACSDPDTRPAPQAEVPMRAPLTPVAALVIAVPGAVQVPHPLRADLTRGAEAVCAPTVRAVLQPVGEGRFRLLLDEPGFLVTRESVLRRTVAGPPDAPELALDGANNGRCDYLLRPAPIRG